MARSKSHEKKRSNSRLRKTGFSLPRNTDDSIVSDTEFGREVPFLMMEMLQWKGN